MLAQQPTHPGFLHGSSACLNGAGSQSTMQMAKLVGCQAVSFSKTFKRKPFLRIFLLPRAVGQAKGMKNLSIRLRFATASNAKVLWLSSTHLVPGPQDCPYFVCLLLYETVSIRSYVPDYGWSSRSLSSETKVRRRYKRLSLRNYRLPIPDVRLDCNILSLRSTELLNLLMPTDIKVF